jgi:CubicO group peptidase (beta-lactamase class C family)
MRRQPARRALSPAVIIAVTLAIVLGTHAAEAQYFPDRLNWETRTPEEVGMDAALLQRAIDFAIASETTAPRDLEAYHGMTYGREPHGEPIGPFSVRGPVTGVIIRHGYIVAEWGEPRRADLTYSVTKSFLSTTVGLAWHHGLIEDLDDRVGPYVAPVDLPAGDGEPGIDRVGVGRPDLAVLFQTEHNREITWDHLLRQVSDWEGTLWGKPDWADRPARNLDAYRARIRPAPGTLYEYNDVRVNLLALAATSVWRRPLPDVLREYVMEPIGASATWRWYGYENSWITLDGQRVQVVSGGAHWGGGMVISARDLARFGLFTLHRGAWDGTQILPEEWFDLATTPTPAQPSYGFMNFYLNGLRARYAGAPETAFSHLGTGANMVYVDPVNDLVVVARWIDDRAEVALVNMVLASIRTP